MVIRLRAVFAPRYALMFCTVLALALCDCFSYFFKSRRLRGVSAYTAFLFVSFFFGPLSSKKKRLNGLGMKS